MKWQLKLLSLLIVAAFAAFALYYYKYFVSPKPPAIILFIVPGLNLDNLAQAGNDLTLTRHSARVAVINNDDLMPMDTQLNNIYSYLATGYKTQPDRIGISTDGRVQDNLLYNAQRAGRTVGLVSTDSITSLELAAFYAHSKTPENRDDLLQQLFDNTKINVILGGGGDDIAHLQQQTGRDLFHEAELQGYKIVRTDDELADVAAWHTRRLLGVFAGQSLPFYDPLQDESGHNPYPSLTTMTRRAIQCLQFNLNGYFLIIHDGLIAQAITDGDDQQTTAEIHQLDHALNEARNFAGKDSIVILYSPYNVATPKNGTPDISYGWLSIYSDSDDELRGFTTAKELYRLIRRNL